MAPSQFEAMFLSAAMTEEELRQVLEGVPLDTPEVMEWIEGSLEEQERALENT